MTDAPQTPSNNRGKVIWRIISAVFLSLQFGLLIGTCLFVTQDYGIAENAMGLAITTIIFILPANIILSLISLSIYILAIVFARSKVAMTGIGLTLLAPAIFMGWLHLKGAL